MFNLFKKKIQWITVPASQVRSGDVVDSMFYGEVLHVYTQTFQDNSTSENIVINMPKPLCGSKIAVISVPPDKPIKIAKK